MFASYKPAHHPMYITLYHVADELEERLWSYTLSAGDDPMLFSRFDIYSPGQQPEQDVLYMLPDTRMDFPVERYPYICVGERDGEADHICVQGQENLALLKLLACILQRFRSLEADLNWLVNRGGGLTELCRIGCDFLQNPVYLHDSMFTVLAQSSRVEGMLELDYNEKTQKYYIPLWLIEDFKFSKGYSETLRQKKAAIWGTAHYPYYMRSLYANIWDEGYYRGRILINELHAPLRRGDFLVAEQLAEYARLILRRDERIASRKHRDSEGTLRTLLSGEAVDPLELRVFLTTLNWRDSNSYLLVRIQSQLQNLEVTSYNVLRSTLSSAFAGSFVLLYEHQLCMVVDMDVYGNDAVSFRSSLAPFLRDSLMYAGASLPVDSIRELPVAMEQAGYALEIAFSLQDYRWLISFDDVALGYLLSRMATPFPVKHYLSPVISALRRYDRAHGSQYTKTLQSYLQNERSVSKTSAAMNIHRTTLLYRLEKIMSLTRLDLSREETRLYLSLSFSLSDQNCAMPEEPDERDDAD